MLKGTGKKKKKDENAPKRPMSAFMLYMNEVRDKIKSDNPGIAFTDIAKKGGELWKSLTDKTVFIYLLDNNNLIIS